MVLNQAAALHARRARGGQAGQLANTLAEPCGAKTLKPSILISHDLADLTVAVELRRYLEAQFKRLVVLCSGVEPEEGTDLQQVRSRLRGVELVIVLMSRRALGNLRLAFEAGAATMSSEVRLLCMDGVRIGDLSSPLSALPSCSLDEAGLKALLSTLVKSTGLILPSPLEGLEELLWSIRSFLSLRNTEEDNAHRPGAEHLPLGSREPVDRAIGSLYKRLREHVRQALVSSMVHSGALEHGQSREQLRALPVPELVARARLLNCPVPEDERQLLIAFEQDVPNESSPRWRKMNACKLLESIDEGLRKFEKSLA